MKNAFIIILVFCSSLAVAQKNPLITDATGGVRRYMDSIRIEFPDQHGLIVFSLNSRLGSEQLKDDFVLIHDALETIAKNTPDTEAPRQVEISGSVGGVRTITVTDSKTQTLRITSTEKDVTQLLPPGWEVRVHLFARAEIYLYAQSFAELKAITAYNTEPVKELIASTSEKIHVGRKRFIARVIVQRDSIIYSDVKFQIPEDFVNITFSTGLGYLHNNFYPELNASMSFQFGNRMNERKNSIGLIYNNLFFTSQNAEGKFSNKTNSFLSLALSRRIGGVKDYTWFTIGAGYLIQKKGDYFTGNTAKFFFSTKTGKFAITPELYLTNNLNDFQIGWKVGYTF